MIHVSDVLRSKSHKLKKYFAITGLLKSNLKTRNLSYRLFASFHIPVKVRNKFHYVFDRNL